MASWRKFLAFALAVFASGAAFSALAQQSTPTIGKTYAQSAEGPKPATVKAKSGAPNIILILLDDVGFGATSAFGGGIPTPNLERLANGGLRYTNFHTAGVCSPTRAALMTGRNHHKVGMGLFPPEAMSAEFPGYNGRLKPEDGTVAEYLRSAGYGTYALGKWHLAPDGDQSDLGPFDRWPTSKGFDHYFGFLGAAADQYNPRLIEDLHSVKPDGRHLNAQLIDKAIFYIDQQNKLAPDKPFFIYLAPGAGHSPHQADQQWIDKYKGKFDSGWDVYRQQVFAKQKKLGLIPANGKLPERDPRVPAWNALSADEKKLYARYMEAYAGFLDYTDSEIGRLVDHLQTEKKLDNTAIFVIVGDNGASKEGGPHGSVNVEFTPITKDDKGQIADLLKRIDDIGTKRAYTNYPLGWAQATDTPFRKWKSDADSEGGTRNPLIVSWPAGLKKTHGLRGQYSHVTDMLPTALEIAGVTQPADLRGIKQNPLQGTSLFYSFQNAKAKTRHPEQYYYLYGSGSVVKDGWKASFAYRPDTIDLFSAFPAPNNPPNNAGKEVWELYDLNTDFNERIDLAAKNPAKLKELQAEFDKQAEANNVYPLINWTDLYGKLQTFLKKYRPPVKAAAPQKD